jgi:hypothetical protein
MKRDFNPQNLPETVQYHRNPTKAEIRFGYGAIHYRDFPVNEVVKTNGSLKKWVKCKYDGLRYYR